MRSAMERVAYGGFWEELVKSSRGDESWYRISALRARTHSLNSTGMRSLTMSLTRSHLPPAPAARSKHTIT